MAFLDDLVGVFSGFVPQATATATRGLPVPAGVQNDEDFFGLRPGFDIGDVPDVLGRIFGGSRGGVPSLPLDPVQAMAEIGATGAPMAGPAMGAFEAFRSRFGGNGNGGQAKVGRTSLYIAGNCPGLWHTTAERMVFDKNTGQGRVVGGNRRTNRVSMVQDDSGALQFVAEVTPRWSLAKKINPGHRHHRHRRKAARHHHHPRRVTRGHRHALTRKQLAAGFGGKSHMKAHR